LSIISTCRQQEGGRRRRAWGAAGRSGEKRVKTAPHHVSRHVACCHFAAEGQGKQRLACPAAAVNAVVAYAGSGQWDRVATALRDDFPAAVAHPGSGRTLLHHAALKGHLPTTTLALHRGACPNGRDCHGWTPTWCAARSGTAAVLRALLAAGGDMNVVCDGWTPLHAVASSCTPDDDGRHSSTHPDSHRPMLDRLGVLLEHPDLCLHTVCNGMTAEALAMSSLRGALGRRGGHRKGGRYRTHVPAHTNLLFVVDHGMRSSV
jgi:hypothetical protein